MLLIHVYQVICLYITPMLVIVVLSFKDLIFPVSGAFLILEDLRWTGVVTVDLVEEIMFFMRSWNIYVCVCVCMHVSVCMCMYACLCVYVYVWMSLCVCYHCSKISWKWNISFLLLDGPFKDDIEVFQKSMHPGQQMECIKKVQFYLEHNNLLM